MKSFKVYLQEASKGKYKAVIHFTDASGKQQSGEVRHPTNKRPLRAVQKFGNKLPTGSKVTKVEYPDDKQP